MQTRTLGIVGVMVMVLAMPGIALAGNGNGTKTKHGIGKGGVPALRDRLEGLIDGLEGRVTDLEGLVDDVEDLDARLEALEVQFTDDDGDTFTEVQGDCDDDDSAVNPNSTEVPANSIDDDCDHLIDEP